MSEEQWEAVLAGLRAGDSLIEHEFWERYGAPLERLAEQRLSPKLQARVGAEDVAQSVCRTFLRRARIGEFTLPDSAALWRVLCVITLNKVREQARYHRRQKRSIEQEIPLVPAVQNSSAAVPDPAAPTTDPAEAVAIADHLEQVLAALDEEDRRVVLLKLQDLTNDEVAAQLNLSERTIRRTLKRVQEQLTRAAGEEPT
jgi:RNA polymerase sigma factor (sigma-70 family)